MNKLFSQVLLLTVALLSTYMVSGHGNGSDEVYQYESYDKDPTQTRIYTLKNGLKVYLSVNKDEPRAQTMIAVRAGSKNDPPETTGLAHYLEHMLFKGTSNIGTQDWKQEQALLAQIAELYEQHKNETDPAVKSELYVQIDQLSSAAAKFAIPNEYDKMVSSMGAKGTNAYTSREQTVYINDIPANELERWLELESERFSELVLRLFHTELEAVYEEFNMSQDRDGSKAFKALMEGAFPTHRYGTQTTIGEGEHLKNPSLYNIEQYFKTYYVPNNMAICISGDIDPDKTIRMIDRYFGKFNPGDFVKYDPAPEAEMKEPVTKEVFGLEAESVMVAYRIPGAGSYEALHARMIDGILFNNQAGLIDLNLVQEQKVLDASTFLYELQDYSLHILEGSPREGQTLEEVKDLLLAQMDIVKAGDYEEWLPRAVFNDQKLSETKQYESNRGRAQAMVDAFTTGVPWEDYVLGTTNLQRVRKESINRFANNLYKNNYVIVYKRKGEDNSVVKVEKPPITPVEANREAASQFTRRFMAKEVESIKPVFADYKNGIERNEISKGLELNYIQNKENDLFELFYILDMGGDHDPLLSLAIDYLPYLGTNDYSAAELQKEFFKLGVSFNVFSSNDRSYVSLRGLESSVLEGVKLFEHILANVTVDKDAYEGLVADILKNRADDKASKRRILWGGLYNYARYGERSRFTDILSESDLQALNPQVLIDRIHELTDYKHKIFYYGAKPMEEVAALLDEHHQKGAMREYPAAKEYKPLAINEDKVYFAHYEGMVQAQVLMVAKGGKYDKKIVPYISLFNEYFGSGLSSIVFQEIRETRALAYSAFANYSSPAKAEDPHYLRAYVATQVDKMPEAIYTMRDLLNNMPEAEQQFNSAVESILKKIETDRTTKSSVFWASESAAKRGLKYDIRKDTYSEMEEVTLEQLKEFFLNYIKDQNYTFVVLGDRSKLDLEMLATLGSVQELTLEQLFNY